MIEDLNNDYVEQDRLANLLQIGADFIPEREANYNFAAKALEKKIVCSRPKLPMVRAFSGATAAVILCGAFMFRMIAAQVTAPPTKNEPVTDNSSRSNKDIGSNGTNTTQTNGSSPDESIQGGHDIGSMPAASTQLASNQESRSPKIRSSRIPKVQWQSETVDRYASGVMTPAWKEDKDATTGQSVYTPVMMTTPVDSGESPSTSGSNSNGTVSLVSYEEKH